MLARASALVLAGLFAGLVAAAIRAVAIDGDLALGLYRLAAERALAIAVVHAAAGATGFLLGAAGARLASRAPTRASAARVGRNAGGFAIGLACTATLVIGLPDATVPDWLTRQRSADGPNVLLVVLDTVRADRLSSYGYPRPTTPELDAFALEAIRYPRFWSTAPWTLPSHASLFTGAYPMHHGATQERVLLGRRFATLAERLRDAGYATFAASANPLVSPLTGLDQGFAAFAQLWRHRDAQPSGAAGHPVTRAFETWIAEQPRTRPFFAFLNYVDAHYPHTPPPELRDRFAREPIDADEARRVGWHHWFDHYADQPIPPAELARRSDLYDAEVAQLSAEIGRLLASLRRDGRYDETIIAITSDHGEHFGEHGRVEHAFSVYESLLRVPLLLHLPGGDRSGSVDDRPGQLVDLFATLLALCGVDGEAPGGEAIDLLDASLGRKHVVAEYYYPNATLEWVGGERVARAGERLAPHLRRLRAIVRDGRKLIWSSDGRHELYDLRRDPEERHDLLSSGPDVGARDLEAALGAVVAQLAEPWATAPPQPSSAFARAGAALDAESAEQLERLGYLR